MTRPPGRYWLSPNKLRLVDSILIAVSIALCMAAENERQAEDLVKPHLEMTPRLIVGMLLATMGLFIAASSGIGGGGMLVPIYILVSQPHPPKHTLVCCRRSLSVSGGDQGAPGGN